MLKAEIKLICLFLCFRASQVALVVKNPPANAGDIRDMGLIPGLGRCLGEGNGNPLQYSCLENPMDRGDWWDTAHGVQMGSQELCATLATKSRTSDTGII